MNQEQVKETTPWLSILLKASSVAEGDILKAIEQQLDIIVELEFLFKAPSFQ